MNCEPGDVAVVPFPFAERPGTKRRPALVLSSATSTAAPATRFWRCHDEQRPEMGGCVAIEGLEESGLPRPCIVRLKLFTLDNRLLLRRAGRLGAEDRRKVGDSLRRHVQGPAQSK